MVGSVDIVIETDDGKFLSVIKSAGNAQLEFDESVELQELLAKAWNSPTTERK